MSKSTGSKSLFGPDSTYLDYNATTPVDDRVLDAMLPYLQGNFANPSSVHRFGRVARAGLDRAREQVAALVDVSPSQVIFTSGGTEANNLALWSVLSGSTPGHLMVSSIEHACVLEPSARWEAQGWRRDLMPVNTQGRLQLDAAIRLLSDDTRLVSLMLANNETGVIQPVAELAAEARQRGALMHTDAVQAAGKWPLRFADTGAHLMTLSAHKIYGPKGVGALIVDKSVEIDPMLIGGGQERNYRSGTENLPGIVGFGMAAELAASGLDERQQKLRALRDTLEGALKAMPQVTIFGAQAERLPNTVQFALQGIDGEALLMQLDRDGIGVSSGSACASGKTAPSHVLMAMGVDEFTARGAIRVSLGKDTTKADIDRLIESLRRQLAWVEQAAGAAAW